MNISSGMSEIKLNSLSGSNGPAKIYVWPKYNQNKIKSINPVKGRDEKPHFYKKASEQEKEEILLKFAKNNNFNYGSNGSLKNSTSLSAGMLFDAIV